MRRSRTVLFVLLVLLSCASLFAQPTLKAPVNTLATSISTIVPTFTWGAVTNTTNYEFYLTDVAADTSNAAIPLVTNVGKSKRYVVTVATLGDNSLTMDTTLAKNKIYYWKVRAKVALVWSAWSKYSKFKIGTPSTSITNTGNALITLDHDNLSAVRQITFLKGSGKQLLDTVYNDANSLGLGGSGSADVVTTWTEKTDTSIYTYKNTSKYGLTGSKVLTIIHNATGITVDMSLTLETGKSSTFSSSWMPGGDLANDNVLLVKSAAVKTALTYPGTAASFGPDSIKLSAMYDTRYNEYFGFKSSSLVAVKDTQKTNYLKQSFTVSNSTGSNKTVVLNFAVKPSRKDYFDTWASNRSMFVTSPATDDTVSSGNNYIHWESFGAVPNSIKFSSDSGKTFSSATAIAGKDTSKTDSVQFSIPSSVSFKNYCVVKIYSTGGDSAVSGFFNVSARIVVVTTPAASGNVTPGGANYIAWKNYTGTAVTGMALSTDSGRTFSGVKVVSSTNAKDSVLYDFYGAKTTTNNCVVRVYTAQGDTGLSGFFSISKGVVVFSIPTVFGDPAGTISVPVNVNDFLTGDSLKAFDIKLTFDSTFVKFNSITYNASINNWVKVMDSSNSKSTNANFVRVSAFKNTTGAGVKNNELFALSFTIKNKQAIIGLTDSLAIRNSVLSAAGNDAASLDVSGSTNGTLKIYSSVSGNLTYFHDKWNASPSYAISGDSLINYFDSTNNANNLLFNVTNGYFNMTNREPNDTINFYPVATKYMTGTTSIDVLDAQLAFKDWHDTLKVRAKIAADINEDSLVNSTDAMAIMEISVDSTYLSRVGKSNWIFVDSASLASFESGSDSLTAWYTQHKHSISYKLVSQRTKQDFFGVLRGDVNFDYAAAAVSTMKKGSSNPVIFSTDDNLNARPGDTVWLPMNINLNGKMIAGFNTSMQVDPSVMTYTGVFKTGSSIPKDKNWYIVAKSDAKGVLRVAGTDFSLAVSPIDQDGPALLFQYVVNKNTKRGTTRVIDVKTQTVVDDNLQKMASDVRVGKVEISRMGATVVKEYELSQNYPNPFNPTTTIEYALPKESRVEIQIFNIIGQRVTTLFTGDQSTGYHQVDWNAAQLGSGVYFYSITASSISDGQTFRSVKKMMLLK